MMYFPRFLVFAALGAGCLSSKEPAYYALAPNAGSVAGGGSAPALVELRRPSLAGYLDRADIVTRVEDYRLRVATLERWAEPLGDMVGRVLGQDLANRLPGTQLFVEAGAISAVPEAIVAVEIQTFERNGDGEVSLVAQVVIERPSSAESAAPQPLASAVPPGLPPSVAPRPKTADGTAKRVSVKAKPKNGSTEALVATMSDLTGQLADQIAALLRGG